MKEKTVIIAIMELVTGVTAIVLTIGWFGWKVGLVVFLITWSTNAKLESMFNRYK